jgi:hypothetical protein
VPISRRVVDDAVDGPGEDAVGQIEDAIGKLLSL